MLTLPPGGSVHRDPNPFYYSCNGGIEELKKTPLLVFIQYFEENSAACHRQVLN
jgi:hypothetical protein